MANSPKSPSGTGCLHKLLVWSLVTGGLVVAVALSLVPQAQDLTDLSGYGTAAAAAPDRDLKLLLQRAVDHGYSVTLTQADLNHWLGRALVTKQGGRFSESVSLDRVWVRLDDGCAEVIMARTILGQPFTVSMFLQVQRMEGPKGVFTEVLLHGGPYSNTTLPLPPRGGRFGKLVVPQGFLLLVVPAYARLADLFRDEIHLGFEEMSRIQIKKGRLVLDPREFSDGQPGRPQTF
ncbi:MAG: hypothetical protein WCJ14_04965 [Verrucomicrobiota bacterium]